MGQVIAMDGKQVALVKRTVAKDCNESEFDLFMAAANAYGLDPFRKQIIPLVFSKNDANKRRMSIVVSRDGLRVIASRCRDYRPASEKAELLYDDALVSATNPKGIVSATVRLWKQDNGGTWFPVIGEAYWDEFAPIADEWGDDPQTGKRRPTGNKTLDATGNWARMPIVMITKCAEAQALRAGWPEQFSGIYVEEEMDRAAFADKTASEMVADEERKHREALAGGKDTFPIWWGDKFGIEWVADGALVDRVIDHVSELASPDARRFADMNRETFRRFWTVHPGDALEVKKAVDAAIAKPVTITALPEASHNTMAG